MPRSHKPRKRYVPKRVNFDLVGRAIDCVATLTTEQRASLLGPVRTAFEAFRTGRGSKAAWCDLADAMNVAEALTEARLASDHVGTFERAQSALASVHGRAQMRGSYTLYPAEITALDDAVFVHGIQLEHCSQGELQNAIDAVKRRVHAALAGNASPRARICVPGHLGRAAAVTA